MKSYLLRNMGTLALAIGGSLAAPMLLLAPQRAFGQATSVNGAIQGSITDNTGAVVRGAAVTITNTGTQQTKNLTTDGSGFYASGPLIPGNYEIKVSASGFADADVQTIVQIGTSTSGNIKLGVSGSQQTIQVDAGQVQVDTAQSNVQDVITAKQIETLPINGRNFLDLAQLEPGVQLQSGGTFDPTKQGYSALSFSGSSGRTTRILLDGQDITDETVGTTIFNVSEGAIGQFQVIRSTSDVSNDIGSTGQVLVSTNSGTNGLHGSLFYNFQDYRAGISSANGQEAPFQRNQYGGSVGGPIIKDKLFFFANAERIKQDGSSPTQVTSLFSSIAAAYPQIVAPYRETYSTGRLDWSGRWNIHYFARVNYNVNSTVTNGGDGYWNYANRDNTPGIAYGADFATGRFTHSLRGSYEKFHNLIVDATQSGVYNGIPGLAFYYAAAHLYSGPNDNAPQATYQSDKQFRYDGSWTKGAHNFRYGASMNRILGGGFASFFGLGPRARLAASSLVAGLDPSNPLNYHATTVYLGNGLGYYTETPQFGAPAGGQGDWRVGAYIADSWKVTPVFTVNYGVRYQRDTGRTDSDLAPIPCSEIDPAYTAPCSGSTPILDQFGAGLGAKIRQPNNNFGPQLGFAYALGKESKTVVRGSIGVFYENSVFNNVLFDRPAKLKTGLFNNYFAICGGVNSFSIPGQGSVSSYNGTSIADLCAEPISQSGPAFVALEAELQKGAKSAGAAANPNYLGESLTEGNGYFAFAPNYKTPYSTQVNLGVQREIARGAVLSADYVHQNAVNIGQTRDVNHLGDAKYFNPDAAKAAVAATLGACGVQSVAEAIINCPGIYPSGGGASISDFASNGLDSANSVNGGYAPQYQFGAGATNQAAFPGANPNLGLGDFQFPSGRSGYDALQVNFRQQKAHPMRGLVDSNLEVSYAYSRFVTDIGGATSSDAFFSGGTWDNNNPTEFIGYGNLDHRHNLSFGGSVTVAHGPQISLIGHFLSAAPTSLQLDNTNGAAGQIFVTDVTGDGTTGDLLPGTNPGAYQRNISGKSLNKAIANYNTRYANTPTPAGQVLINNGIFTAAQLAAIGGVQQPIAAAPQNADQNPMFRQVDASLFYPIRLHWINESASLQPGIAAYNVANFANYNDPTGNLINTTNAPGGGSDNYVNGSNNYDIKNSNRVLRQSGTFDSGAGRSLEYQLKFIF